MTFLLSVLLLAAPAAADPLAALKNTYDGVRVHESNGRVMMVYGAPMSPGFTPDDAAQRFWDDHGRIFRGTQPELIRRFDAFESRLRKCLFGHADRSVDG